MSIFGRDLAPETAAAEAVPLPTEISGVSVQVNEIPARLYFVAAGQINVHVPFEASGGRAIFTVTTPDGRSPEFVALLHPTAPGVFTASGDGRGEPLLLNTGFAVVSDLEPGEHGILYATGLGRVAPAVSAGQSDAEVAALNRLLEPLQIYIGGRPVAVEFAGLAPGLPGVYQVNFVVPDNPNGDRMLVVAGGRSGNVTRFPVTPATPVAGSNVLVRETREIGEFSRIQLVAVAGVRVQVGQAGGSLEIEAEDNLLSLIETTSHEGTLRITATRPYTTNEGPTITVATPSLERVEVLGVGGVEAAGVFGESFEVRLAGVGNVAATGSVETVDVISGGVGNVSLFGLQASGARVQAFGVSNVEVHASDSLVVRLSGAGYVSYRGQPLELDIADSGPGSIQQN